MSTSLFPENLTKTPRKHNEDIPIQWQNFPGLYTPLPVFPAFFYVSSLPKHYLSTHLQLWKIYLPILSHLCLLFMKILDNET